MLTKEQQKRQSAENLHLLNTYLFFDAVKRDRVERAKEFLKAGADINCYNGESLIAAIDNNSIEMMSLLLVSPEIPSNIKLTSSNKLNECITRSAECGEENTLEFLLKTTTTLHYIKSQGLFSKLFVNSIGHLPIQKLLVQYNKNAFDELKTILLFRSLNKKCFDVAQFILEQGVVIEDLSAFTNEDEKRFIQSWQLQHTMKEKLNKKEKKEGNKKKI